MPTLQCHAEQIGNLAFLSGLSLSMACIIQGIVACFDAHPWLPGFIVGVVGLGISTVVQIYFKRMYIKALKAGADRRKTEEQM